MEKLDYIIKKGFKNIRYISKLLGGLNVEKYFVNEVFKLHQLTSDPKKDPRYQQLLDYIQSPKAQRKWILSKIINNLHFCVIKYDIIFESKLKFSIQNSKQIVSYEILDDRRIVINDGEALYFYDSSFLIKKIEIAGIQIIRKLNKNDILLVRGEFLILFNLDLYKIVYACTIDGQDIKFLIVWANQVVTSAGSSMYIWDLSPKPELYNSLYINSKLKSLCVIDDDRLAAGYDDGDILIWSKKGHRRKLKTTNPSIIDLKLVEGYLISNSNEGLLKWDLTTYKSETISRSSLISAFAIPDQIVFITGSCMGLYINNLNGKFFKQLSDGCVYHISQIGNLVIAQFLNRIEVWE